MLFILKAEAGRINRSWSRLDQVDLRTLSTLLIPLTQMWKMLKIPVVQCCTTFCDCDQSRLDWLLHITPVPTDYDLAIRSEWNRQDWEWWLFQCSLGWDDFKTWLGLVIYAVPLLYIQIEYPVPMPSPSLKKRFSCITVLFSAKKNFSFFSH